MKDAINQLEENRAKDILKEIMGVYFDKGFGIMNKTEIETLIYFALKNTVYLLVSVLMIAKNYK